MELNDCSKYEMRMPEPFKANKQANKWWNRPLAAGIKWETLEHNGVLFPPAYVAHGVKMLYDGKPVDLTPEQEEVATFYSTVIESEQFSKNPVFNTNFFLDFSKLLGAKHVIKEFDKCDFSSNLESFKS